MAEEREENYARKNKPHKAKVTMRDPPQQSTQPEMKCNAFRINNFHRSCVGSQTPSAIHFCAAVGRCVCVVFNQLMSNLSPNLEEANEKKTAHRRRSPFELRLKTQWRIVRVPGSRSGYQTGARARCACVTAIFHNCHTFAQWVMAFLFSYLT